MLFNSLEYWLFLPLVLALDALVGTRWSLRKWLLLAASYVFYMAWNPPFVALLLGSTALDYVAGKRIAASSDPGPRRFWITASLVGNLGVLAFFKYADFFASNLFGFLPGGPEVPAFIRNLVLPMGISFYTFQSLSYSIDVYRGRRAPARSWLDLALYVSFFPQLVAGPIVRAADFLPQLENPRRPTPEDRLAGLEPLFRGIAKKVLIADSLALYVDLVYASPGEFGGFNHWLALYAYAFQIYFDFSGYSDIAIGSARLLGFRIPDNFRLPYLAAGPSDFWNRWHISLSSWLRDYLYISLGGSRGSRVRTLRNLLLTMLLGGLWHGAAWGFLAWGAYHGTWLVLHRVLFRERRLLRVPRWLSIPITFHAVCIGWVFFRAESIADARIVFSRLFDFEAPLVGVPGILYPLLALSFASHLLGASSTLRALWEERSVDLRAISYAAIALAAYAFASESVPFIYFQF